MYACYFQLKVFSLKGFYISFACSERTTERAHVPLGRQYLEYKIPGWFIHYPSIVVKKTVFGDDF